MITILKASLTTKKLLKNYQAKSFEFRKIQTVISECSIS